jgi:hypothetical protein
MLAVLRRQDSDGYSGKRYKPDDVANVYDKLGDAVADAHAVCDDGGDDTAAAELTALRGRFRALRALWL